MDAAWTKQRDDKEKKAKPKKGLMSLDLCASRREAAAPNRIYPGD
jgi:hypothetical protein